MKASDNYIELTRLIGSLPEWIIKADTSDLCVKQESMFEFDEDEEDKEEKERIDNIIDKYGLV